MAKLKLLLPLLAIVQTIDAVAPGIRYYGNSNVRYQSYNKRSIYSTNSSAIPQAATVTEQEPKVPPVPLALIAAVAAKVNQQPPPEQTIVTVTPVYPPTNPAVIYPETGTQSPSNEAQPSVIVTNRGSGAVIGTYVRPRPTPTSTTETTNTDTYQVQTTVPNTPQPNSLGSSFPSNPTEISTYPSSQPTTYSTPPPTYSTQPPTNRPTLSPRALPSATSSPSTIASTLSPVSNPQTTNENNVLKNKPDHPMKIYSTPFPANPSDMTTLSPTQPPTYTTQHQTSRPTLPPRTETTVTLPPSTIAPFTETPVTIAHITVPPFTRPTLPPRTLPPATLPPLTAAPTTQPPVTKYVIVTAPPFTRPTLPPRTQPPVTLPPSTAAPTTQPPAIAVVTVTVPPFTRPTLPPRTQPPVTLPLSTAAPTTQPPAIAVVTVTVPPFTRPTLPPRTLPPVTLPPSSAAPTTQPPATTVATVTVPPFTRPTLPPRTLPPTVTLPSSLSPVTAQSTYYPTQGTNTAITYTPPQPPVISEPDVIQGYNCQQANGYFSVPNKCDSYVECKENVAVRHTCPDGLHFNPNSKYQEYPCAYPVEVQCTAGLISQTPRPVGQCPNLYGYYPIQGGDCSKYLVCQDGIANIMTCPSGLVFNEKIDDCDWPINVPSCNLDIFKGFTCPSQPDSDLIEKFRFKGSCTSYVACQRGYPRLLNCELGLRYDEATQSCVDASKVTDCSA